MCDSGVSLTSCCEDSRGWDTGTEGRNVTIQVSNPPTSSSTRVDLRARPRMAPISPTLSRSGSTSSLASSLSCAPAQEVRALTHNFQRLLAQATAEIKKLTAEKHGLEKEQEKLLTVNVELARETKKLLQQQKEWKEQEKGLLKANQEFVAEVERLYKEEETWEEEVIKLREEQEELTTNLSNDVEQARLQLETERDRHQEEQDRLVESVHVLTQDNDRLLHEREREKQTNSMSQQELQQEFLTAETRLKATISCLEGELETELQARDAAETEAERITEQLEKVEHELEEEKKEHREQLGRMRSSQEIKIDQLEKRGEKMAAENFELGIETEEMNKKLKHSQDMVRKMEREIGQVQVEKEWLISQQKMSAGNNEKAGDLGRQLEEIKVELREEKMKVKNLADWKSQLAEKNKELKDDNLRLVARAENLEQLMNEEATDINEMLKVISNIQMGKEAVDIKTLKKRYM